jgi:hypothetical protein
MQYIESKLFLDNISSENLKDLDDHIDGILRNVRNNL